MLVLDADRVASELADTAAIRGLARAIAAGEEDAARTVAADLLERSG